MSTANLPTVSCLLDDGSGTFPIDISAYVNQSAGITWGNVGRADWDTQPSPATLEFTVGNDSGVFTIGTGFGLGAFGAGPFGGIIPIAKGQRIRFGLTLGATSRTCFTGRIDSLTQTFTGPAGKRSGITVQAVDALQELARRPMRSMLEQEILLTAPAAYYTLAEPETSTSAGDTSGHGETPLLPVMYGGATYAFGVDLGLATGFTGVAISDNASPTGAFLSKGGDASGFGQAVTWSANSLCITAVFRQNGFNSALATPLVGISGGPLTNSIQFDSTGHALLGPSVASPQVLTDGLPHIITIQLGNGLSSDLWVDGVKVASTAPVVGGTWDNRFVDVYGQGVANAVTQWGHFAYGPRTSDAQVASIHQAAAGTLAEATDARLTRLAAYAGLSATTVSPSGQVMPLQATSGVSMLDAFQAVAEAENGVLFVNGLGVLTLQGRNYRGQRLTADVTLPGKALDPASTSIIDDTAQTINQVTATRVGGTTQTWPTTPPSSVFPQSYDLAVDTDASALARAQWTVAKHSNPAARMGSASTSNMLTSPSASALLAMEIGNRVALTSMPATTTPNLGTALSVEGWTMSLTIDGGGGSWVWVLNLVPWSFFKCAIWGDSGSTWGSAVWGL